MNILEMNKVILVLLLIFCFTNIVENASNGKGVYKIKTRHRRNKNDVVGTPKWLRRFPKEDRLSFQRYLKRELLSNNDLNTKSGHSSTKRWIKRNLRRMEKKYYFNSNFIGYRKSRVIRGKRRNKFKDKQWKEERHYRAKEKKRMRFKEFIPPLHDRWIDYNHVATLRSQKLTESELDGLDKNHLPSERWFRIAFNVTSPHRVTPVADYAKLMLYFSIGRNTNGDNNTARSTHSCNCNIEISELLWISERKVMEEAETVVTLPRTSIKNNAWNSFDISDIIKVSTLFDDNNNNSNPKNISNTDIRDIDSSQKENIFHKNKEGEYDDDNTKIQTLPLLYIYFQYSNCSFPNQEEIQPNSTKGRDDKAMLTENQCALNLKPVINSGHHNDDKNPLLVLLSEKQTDTPYNKTKNINHGPYSETGHSNFLTDDHKILKSSKINVFPNFSDFPFNATDSISRNFENRSRFQVLPNVYANETLSMSTMPKTRSKRRARRFRGGRNRCRREEMYVDFANTRWANFIVFPKGYQAYQCVGRCYFPMDQGLTPTMHAIIQSLMHVSQPRRARRACCVPTKLKPRSVVYRENGGTVKKDFEDMIVIECGCR